MSMPELYEASMDYDIFVTGSDQVWNPGAQSSIEPYFLTFAPDSARKISFAASFGVSEIEPNLRERYKEYLSRYDFISVREQNACDMVKQLVGKDAECVLDPTLLLTKDEWMKVARQYDNVPERYVLVYTLFDSPAIFNLAKRIAQEKGISVLRITKRAYFVNKIDGVCNILDAGPAEFVSIISGADYVVTDSFHGTVFSVNFGVPFSVVVSSKKKNNSRMESLLELVGLNTRMINENMDMENVEYETAIDISMVVQKLNDARHCSIEFIKRAIC
jgi:polysaccharide pyruvyl transferase WcaK-like protein